EVAGGFIENVYRLQFINVSESPLTLHLGASGLPGLTAVTADHGEETIVIEPASNRLVPIVVRAPALEVEPGLHDIEFEVEGTIDNNGREVIRSERSSFYVPK